MEGNIFVSSVDYYRARYFEAIDDERIKQDDKWGSARTRFLPMTAYVTVLAEEFGEVAQAILKNDRTNLEKEIIQMLAVGVAMLESLDTSPLGLEEKDIG